MIKFDIILKYWKGRL